MTSSRDDKTASLVRIYIMQAPNMCLKIGYSKHPEIRRKQIGSLVKIVALFEPMSVNTAKTLERLTHNLLALSAVHVRAEWFAASVEQAQSAIEVARRQADNKELRLGCGTLRHKKHNAWPITRNNGGAHGG